MIECNDKNDVSVVIPDLENQVKNTSRNEVQNIEGLNDNEIEQEDVREEYENKPLENIIEDNDNSNENMNECYENEKEVSESSEHNQRKNTRSREPVKRYVPTCTGKR